MDDKQAMRLLQDARVAIESFTKDEDVSSLKVIKALVDNGIWRIEHNIDK